MGEDRLLADITMGEWDAAALLKLTWDDWHDVFRKTLGQAERSLISELRDIHNHWAHQNRFSTDDAYLAMDSIGRLLSAVSAPEVDEIERMKMELLRLRFDEQVRNERRKSTGGAIVSAYASYLKPWREVVTPHIDVASSRYQQAEFAADLGKVHACRRVALVIYLGSAPTPTVANRGLEDRRVKLGCVVPAESPAVFGDALRTLAAAATFLYQDGPRYWYSTQPTVTKLAEDRARQLKRDQDKIAQELDRRLRADLQNKGDFGRIHPLPGTSADVPDDLDARLVVLSADYPYSKEGGNPAARAIFENRGTQPRLFRNTLIFLAPDKTRWQDLDEALRKVLAWESILDDKETLDLSPHQVKQAEAQRKSADSSVTARLPETYQWLIVPTQTTPQSSVIWQAIRLAGQDALAVRAGKKLRSEELLVMTLGPTSLRLELGRVPLWRGNHVSLRQLVDDFARYLYLPRLKDTQVLLDAIRDGFGLLTWENDSFAYAESYDEGAQRYRGLRFGQLISVREDDPGLLVRPEVAKPKRFHGSASLDPARVGRDASRIADEVITHLLGLVGSRLRVTLEIEADIPSGAPDNVVRTVTENSRTLKFTTHGFEKE